MPSLASVTRADASTTSRASLPASTGEHAQIETELVELAAVAAAAATASVGNSSRGGSPSPRSSLSSSPSTQAAADATDILSVSSPSINDHTAVPSPELPTRPLPPAPDDENENDNDNGYPRPMSARTASFASSMISEDTANTNGMYDYLPSSPASSASSLAHKPLLDQSPSLPAQPFNSAANAGDINNVGA